MTHKEYAYMLVAKFQEHADWNNEYGSAEPQANFRHAKQCAKISAQLAYDEAYKFDTLLAVERQDYWKEVLKCIEAL